MPHRSPDHEPRFPGFTAQIPEQVTEIVFCQYGASAPDAQAAAGEVERLRGVFAGDAAPDVLDRGVFVDRAGEHNDVLLVYWFDRQRFEAWRESAATRSAWRAHADSGPIGVWRETATISRSRLESLYSHPPGFARTSGISDSFEQDVTPYHDYWGAARDRIAESRHDPLHGELDRLDSVPSPETRGRRLTVTGPANLCLIRTAQDWTQSRTFRDVYLNDVAPVKDAGMEFLRRTPETGCIEARNISETDLDGRLLDRSCTVAWFISLGHLEDWSKSHKTHLAIYGSFFKMLQHSSDPLDVVFWHEVSVLPRGAVRGEYVNCHPDCGLLRLGAADRLHTEEGQWVHTTVS
jgi:Haem-containing dehydratase